MSPHLVQKQLAADDPLGMTEAGAEPCDGAAADGLAASTRVGEVTNESVVAAPWKPFGRKFLSSVRKQARGRASGREREREKKEKRVREIVRQEQATVRVTGRLIVPLQPRHPSHFPPFSSPASVFLQQLLQYGISPWSSCAPGVSRALHACHRKQKS